MWNKQKKTTGCSYLINRLKKLLEHIGILGWELNAHILKRIQ